MQKWNWFDGYGRVGGFGLQGCGLFDRRTVRDFLTWRNLCQTPKLSDELLGQGKACAPVVVCVAPDLVQEEVMLKNLGAGPPASARWSSQTGVGALKTKMCFLAIQHLEARSLETLKSIQSRNLRVFDDH